MTSASRQNTIVGSWITFATGQDYFYKGILVSRIPLDTITSANAQVEQYDDAGNMRRYSDTNGKLDYSGFSYTYKIKGDSITYSRDGRDYKFKFSFPDSKTLYMTGTTIYNPAQNYEDGHGHAFKADSVTAIDIMRRFNN